jgi:hypothetical protein
VRVLLIAYEYPPIVAAQALRWFYLANALAESGVEVHVLCPSLPSVAAYPVANHAGVVEHRVWPGPFMGLSQFLSGRVGQAQTSSDPGGAAGEGWLFKVYRWSRRTLDHLLYPDARSEWYPFARARLGRLLREHRFDALISSHEPGVDLLLGLWARRRSGLPWLVDLADPLCAPYSPGWRRRLDLWVERRVLLRADKVIVTTDALRDVLVERHAGLEGDKFACIPQGAPTGTLGETRVARPMEKLHIVFTGNFYGAFRDPSGFAQALRALSRDDIAFTVAGDNGVFAAMFAGIGNVRFLGKRDHFECLALQRQADVLLNIGNAQSFQIPGKVYEYLGAAKPILHILGGPNDPGAEVLADVPQAVVVANTPAAIAEGLRALHDAWRVGELARRFPCSAEQAARHSWEQRAGLLRTLLASLPRGAA